MRNEETINSSLNISYSYFVVAAFHVELFENVGNLDFDLSIPTHLDSPQIEHIYHWTQRNKWEFLG